VSVAKAGIVAKFKAKTAILAAANPKFGRFDPNKLPGMQFDIPPTILSRFDLIFPIIDVLDEAKDTALAQHLLSIHQKGANATEAEKTSEMDPLFLRKYISYARQHVKPLLSVEASDRIKEFYVEIRKRGKAEGAVPVTPRQIEGLVRMAEASAKIRLSNAVEISDAERAITLTNYVLDKVSRDRETGRIDADIIMTGRPKSQVDKINSILSIVQKLQSELGAAEIVRVIDQAVSENVDEITARRIVDDLIYKGELYKVKPGFVKLVEQQSG
ncbi:TPA: minichromosome maintenance protein MCM, partial [Candidatus Micrarchaeota archaeon]|nr:minichromosome maintenance protein MCM [Candidatus Micrarchaeota archaeon]